MAEVTNFVALASLRPDLSKLRLGHLKLVSVEKLMPMLTTFNQDVAITAKPQSQRGEAGRITFVRAARPDQRKKDS
jgi:hypothetical protein